MRILIVKLSSLGDIVHALPVVADIRNAHPGAVIDWVAEPSFAALLERTAGVAEVIACPLRRWTKTGLWRPAVVAEIRAFVHRLRRERYDAIVDLQGLTKSAVIAKLARGPSFGLANRTDGASHEWPARRLATTAIRVEPHSHALDRSRELVARALGTRIDAPPSFGLSPRVPPNASDARTVVFIHGSSRADKLWREASWVELGRRLVGSGCRIALPQASADEGERAARIATAIGAADCDLWSTLPLAEFIDRLAATAGAIGVDSGPSHIATALGLPHVQLYNFPTSWRTGPQAGHGARQQVAVEGEPTPSVDAVWTAWQRVASAAAVLP